MIAAMSRSRFRAPPFGAVAEIMARDAEREGPPFGGWAGELAAPPADQAPAPAPAPIVIPPPPWAESYRPEPEPVVIEEDTEPRPAPKQRGRSSTPNLDQVRAWREKEAP
jgi:hypothetical protein